MSGLSDTAYKNECKEMVVNYCEPNRVDKGTFNQGIRAWDLTLLKVMISCAQTSSYQMNTNGYNRFLSPYHYTYIIFKSLASTMNKQPSQLEPFQQFFDKMNQDLAGWLHRQKDTHTLLQDYKSTLRFIEQDFQTPKIMVNLGQNCYAKVKRTNEMIIIRCTQDIYVSFSKAEALPMVKLLIGIYENKVKVCKDEICKIMVAMREMESLIQQYQTIA